MRGRGKKPAAIPTWVLVGLVGLCVAGAFLLMPDRRGLLERQLRDGKTEEALKTLHSISADDRRSDPEFFALTEIRLMREAAKTPAELRDAMANAARAAAEFGYKTNFVAELMALGARVESSEELERALGGNLEKAPEDLQRAVTAELVKRTLAEGKPARAAAAYSNLWARFPSEAGARELARLLRQADQAAKALAVMQTLSGATNAATLRDLADVAKAAGRLDLATNALAKLRAVEPANSGLALEFAQTLEWSNAPDLAFDEYLSALRHDNKEAVAKALALAGPLGRTEELLEALLAKPNLADTIEMRLQVARLAADSARYKEAKAAFEEVLRARPKDFDLRVEYGTLLMNLFEFADAERVFAEAKGLQPEALAPDKALAEIKYRRGDYDGALAAYRSLVSRTKDEDAIKAYVTLAESLGRVDAIIDGLRRQVSQTKSAYDFERLAFNLNSLGRTNDYVATLEEGLRANPANAELTMRLAYALADRGEYGRAIALLSGDAALRRSREMANLYLSALIRAQKLKEADAFLRSGVAREILEDTETLGLRAQVAEGLNQLPEAMRLFERLHAGNLGSSYIALNYARLLAANGRSKEAAKILEPFLEKPSDETLALAAQIFSEAGNYKSAEEWQRKFIAKNPSARAWGFLGDILLSRGDKINARRAYQKAADAMVKEIAAKTRQ